MTIRLKMCYYFDELCGHGTYRKNDQSCTPTKHFGPFPIFSGYPFIFTPAFWRSVSHVWYLTALTSSEKSRLCRPKWVRLMIVSLFLVHHICYTAGTSRPACACAPPRPANFWGGSTTSESWTCHRLFWKVHLMLLLKSSEQMPC
jgi:hypothetical protein